MEGSCQCGAVRFETPTEKPLDFYHCHCTDCRKQSASAFGTSVIFPFFEIPAGQPVSVLNRKTDSGRMMNCYFCSKCGSRLLHAHVLEEGQPKGVAVKGGALDGFNWEGAKHIFCRSAVVKIPEGVQRFEGSPYESGVRE